MATFVFIIFMPGLVFPNELSESNLRVPPVPPLHFHPPSQHTHKLTHKHSGTFALLVLAPFPVQISPTSHAVCNALKRVAIIFCSMVFILDAPWEWQSVAGGALAILGAMLYAHAQH